MSNTYFRFKKFTVHQDRCAMKVCTDSCLFGAWVADWLVKNNPVANNVLDIGAGTGLLSLLISQKIETAHIDALEINASAAMQAKENFIQSLYASKLSIYNENVSNFSPQKNYDCIITNPPFYEHDLQGNNKAKNTAHHNAGLTLHELIKAIDRLLFANGIFFILLPFQRVEEFVSYAGDSGFFINQKTLVKQTEKHNYFRSICLFSRNKSEFLQNEIIIKDEQDNYTNAFILLLTDYYIHL